MYAQYTYVPGATQANVLADLVAILTGTIDVNQLSASCSKVVSSIIATTPAGWTLADAAAGVNAKALTAPLADDPTKLKSIVLDTNTANFLAIKLYESWNATTHVGINIAYSSDTSVYRPALTLSLGGTLFISASARHCLIATQNSTFTAFGAPSGVVEHTRNDPWNTVANGYPSCAYITLAAFGPVNANPEYYLFAPRLYNPNVGADVTGASAGLGAYSPMMCSNSWISNMTNNYTPTYTNGSGTPIAMGANASKQQTHLLVPLGLARNETYVVLGGDISANSGLYATTRSAGNSLDEITVGADTFVIWPGLFMSYNINMYPRFAIKKA